MKKEVKNIVIDNLHIVECGEIKYCVCKSVCRAIGLNKNRSDRAIANLKADCLLYQHIKKIEVIIDNVLQKCWCINLEHMDIWLTKFNTKTLDSVQYNNLIQLINHYANKKFNNDKKEESLFDFESHLRDEIYDLGSFGNIKVIDKEVSYNFGRIDLLGEDDAGCKVCIELKKFKEFSDTKSQLTRYKDSNLFSKIIYIAYEIDNEFKKWCKENNIDTYTYYRQLKFQCA